MFRDRLSFRGSGRFGVTFIRYWHANEMAGMDRLSLKAHIVYISTEQNNYFNDIPTYFYWHQNLTKSILAKTT